jgi:hypothetical protein
MCSPYKWDIIHNRMTALMAWSIMSKIFDATPAQEYFQYQT